MDTKIYKTSADNGTTGTLNEVFDAVINYGDSEIDLERFNWYEKVKEVEAALRYWAEEGAEGTFYIGNEWIEKVN